VLSPAFASERDDEGRAREGPPFFLFAHRFVCRRAALARAVYGFVGASDAIAPPIAFVATTV
jgi:hypothetical protein